jgi:hypothetical protein
MATLSNNTTNDKSMNGLVTIDANSISTDELDVDTLVVNLSGTAPTVSALSNDTNIATTAWVTNHASATYVTLGTTQTVTGQKTFSNANTFITGNTVTNSIQSVTNNNLVLEGVGTGDAILKAGGTNRITCADNGAITIAGSSGQPMNITTTGNMTLQSASNTDISIASNQTSGILNLGISSSRSGGINLGTGMTSGSITIGGGTSSTANILIGSSQATYTGSIAIGSVVTGNAPITIGSSVSTTQIALHNALTTFKNLVVVDNGILLRLGFSATGLTMGKTGTNEITFKLIDSSDILYFNDSSGTNIMYMSSTEIVNTKPTTFSGAATFNNDVLIQQSTYPSTNTSQLGYNKTETLAEFTFTADTLGTIGSFTVPSKGVWGCNISVKYRTTGGAGSFENVQLFLTDSVSGTTAYRTFEYFDETDVTVGASGKRFVHTISGTLTTTASQTFYIRGLNDTTGITTLAEAIYSYTRVG